MKRNELNKVAIELYKRFKAAKNYGRGRSLCEIARELQKDFSYDSIKEIKAYIEFFLAPNSCWITGGILYDQEAYDLRETVCLLLIEMTK